jgi:hypothetical protein
MKFSLKLLGYVSEIKTLRVNKNAPPRRDELTRSKCLPICYPHLIGVDDKNDRTKKRKTSTFIVLKNIGTGY